MRRFVALVSWYHSVRADLPVACTLSQIEGRKWQFNVCGTSYADSSELRDCGQHCLVNESDEEKIEITLFRMMPPSARLDHPSVERHWNQSADDAYYSADAQRDLVYRIQGSNVSGAGEWTQIYNEAISVTLFPPHDQGPRRTFIAHMFYKTTEVEPSEPNNVLRANSDCSFTQIGWYFGDIASPTARARQFGCFYAGVMGKHLSEGRNLAVGESTNRRAAQRTRGLFQDRDFRDMAFLQRPERSKYERYPSPTPQQVMLRQERAGPKNGRLSEADLGGMPVRRLVLRDGRNIGAPSEHTDDEIEGRAIAPNESAQNPLSEEPDAGDDEDPLVRVSMEESSPHESQMMLDLTTMRELAAKINSGNYGWQAKVYPQFVRSTTTPFSLKFRQKLRASEARSDNATKRMDAGLARTRREDGSTKKKTQSLSFCHDTTFPRGPARGKDLPEACSWATLTGESVNQGSCGSCYAVSSVHMLQARYFKSILDKEFPDEITKGACDSMFDNPRVRKRLAELWNTHRLDYQDVIDNDGLNSPMNEGCNGGFPFLVLSWYKNTGRKVPFLGNQSRKSPSYEPPSVISMRYLGTHGYAPEATATCSHERRMMQRLVEHGPLTISLLWTGCMEAVTQLYQSGVIGASPDGSFMSDCQDAEAGWPKIGYRKTDHAVLLSGYGVDNGAEYWHVQNSWGHTWGEGGYFKMARNLYGIDLAVDGLVDQPVEMPQ